MHNYQLYLLMSEQHVRLNPVITLQHVSPLTCQVFRCSIKGVINGELFLSLTGEHRLQVQADTCKYQHYKTLKHWPLICKTQAINRMKWIKLQVSLPLWKANVFEQNCDAYMQYKAFKWSRCHTGLSLSFSFLPEKTSNYRRKVLSKTS